MRLDARIPVRVTASGRAPVPCRDAVLLRVGGAAEEVADPSGWAAVRSLPDVAIGAGHAVGCACCGGRPALALALGGMVAQRARSELPWFDSVVLLVPDGLVFEAVATLRNDGLLSGRFRYETEK